jgi:hypothetical protein
MTRIHFKQLSWNQLRLFLQKSSIAIKAVVKRDFVFRLRVSLRNEHGCKVLLEDWHHYVGRIVFVDASGNDEFTKVAVLLRDSLFKQRLASNYEDLLDFFILAETLHGLAE